MSDVLSASGLAKSYGSRAALHDLTLSVGKGQVFGLLGPNGSGKTTTLGVILGVVHADRGRYAWFGSDEGGRQRRRIGALLEQPAFYPWLSGEANLSVLAAVKGLSTAAVLPGLAAVGLTDARKLPFAGYSLGMKQRLAIAGALMGTPEVLVLDEPTNGVDAQGIVQIRSIIGDFARRGGTVILASHLLDEVQKVCTHVAILKSGRVVETGATQAILATDGWVDLAAADLDALESALLLLEPAARITRQGGLLELRQSSLRPAELNERLASRGIYVSHLAPRQPSLEGRYLDLVGDAASGSKS